MSVIKRKVTPFEMGSFLVHCDTQFALEIEHPKYINEIIEKIYKSAIGLRISFDGENYVSMNKPIEPIILKTTTNAHDACVEIHNKRHDYSKSIGTIGYNDKYIALNLNHSVGDGTTYHNILKTVLDEYPKEKLQNIPRLHESAEETFKDILKNVDKSFPAFNPEIVTRIKTKEKLAKGPDNAFAHEYAFKDSVKNFKVYDKRTGKVHGMTDNVWTAYALSMGAFSGSLTPFGLSTVINTRPYMNKPDGIEHSNHCGFIFLNIPVTPNTTIKEANRRLRADLKYKMERGDQFESMIIPNVHYATEQGSLTCVSQIAPFKIKRPINDLYLRWSGYNRTQEILSLIGITVINTDKNTNIYKPSITKHESISQFAFVLFSNYLSISWIIFIFSWTA